MSRKIGYAAKFYVENCSDCPFNNSAGLAAFYSCKLQENPKRFYVQKSDMFLDCKLSFSDIIKCLIDKILLLSINNDLKNHMIIQLANVDSYGSLRSNYIMMSQLVSIFLLFRESLVVNTNSLKY